MTHVDMKPAILLLAWGAGSMQARAGLEMVEARCKRRFPDLPVRWAYTSELLRERLINEKRKSDSVTKALWKLFYERYRQVALQPIQVIPGRENDSVREAAADASRHTGMQCIIGAPLLGSMENIKNVAKALIKHIPEERKPEDDVIFMGHGGRNDGTLWYGHLAENMTMLDKHVFIGTMGGKYDLKYIEPLLSSRRVWLLPLFATIGKHASNDMAGSHSESWRSKIDNAGHICIPVLKSLCESELLVDIWLDNLEKVLHGFESSGPSEI